MRVSSPTAIMAQGIQSLQESLGDLKTVASACNVFGAIVEERQEIT